MHQEIKWMHTLWCDVFPRFGSVAKDHGPTWAMDFSILCKIMHLLLIHYIFQLLLTESGSFSWGMIINVSLNCVLASAVILPDIVITVSVISVQVTLVQLIPLTLLQTQAQSLPLFFDFNRELCLQLFPAVLNNISLLTDLLTDIDIYVRNV